MEYDFRCDWCEDEYCVIKLEVKTNPIKELRCLFGGTAEWKEFD